MRKVTRRPRGEEPDLGADFPGEAYDPLYDHARLTGQLLRVYTVMADGAWRTVREIEEVTGDPGPSILAQLGHLRKKKFGAYTVEKRPRGRREDGLWEYRVGAKGSHVPRKPALLVRAERAEDMAAKLASALREVNASASVLKLYDSLYGTDSGKTTPQPREAETEPSPERRVPSQRRVIRHRRRSR